MAQSPQLCLAGGPGTAPAADYRFHLGPSREAAAEESTARSARRSGAPARVATVALLTAFYLAVLVAAFALVMRMWTV